MTTRKRTEHASPAGAAWTDEELYRRYKELEALYASMPDEEGLEIVLVTERIADELLASNIESNRAKKPRDIEKMARDMAAGLPGHRGSRWKFNGDTLRRTPDGETIDGQLRCEAFKLARQLNPGLRYFRTGVAFNIERDAILVTDTGARRSFKDWLKLMGQRYQTNAAAIVRRIFEWELGNYTDVRGFGALHAGFIQPTEAELAEFWRPMREEFESAINVAVDAKAYAKANTTAVGTAYFLLHRIDPQECKGFFENLVEGANLGTNDPVKRLRDRIMQAGRRGADRAHRLTATEQLYLLFLVWNARREDDTIPGRRYKKLALPSSGITNANFIQPR